MTLGRRAFLAAGPLLAIAPKLALGADALPVDSASMNDARLSPRIIGNPDAKVIVDEWFSLTCTHCAEFSNTVFPQVKEKLIDTGKIRYRFHDFPIDKVALLAAMVARSLPESRYEAFVSALFQTQMQWAFAQGVDPVEGLRKQAAIAGISSAQFDTINADDALRQAIVDRQDRDAAFLQISHTPFFRVNETPAPDIQASYDTFARAVAKAS